MYPLALESGISPSLFWNLSIGEIVDMISANAKEKYEHTKLDVSSKYIQAKQIVELIVIALNSKHSQEPMQIWEYYPMLFAKEKEQYEKEKQLELLEDYKMKRAAFAKHREQMMGGEIYDK